MFFWGLGVVANRDLGCDWRKYDDVILIAACFYRVSV